MFEKNYYCLVSSLRELALEGDNRQTDVGQLYAQIMEELSARDLKQAVLLRSYFDMANLITLFSGGNRLSDLGNFTDEQIRAEFAKPTELPRFAADIINAYRQKDNAEWDDTVDRKERFERNLLEAYYKKCAQSSCRFLRQWSEFERITLNIKAALSARKANRQAEGELVGRDQLTEQMARSSSSDLGLKGETDFGESIIAILSDTDNLIERERKLDLVRWAKAEELATFDYFNINTLLAFMVKASIIERWSKLDAATGRMMYKRLTEELTATE